jgi:hypothetical protein
MNTTVLIGCDPELFILDKNERVIPSPQIIDGEISVDGFKNNDLKKSKIGSIVRDGFQVELHPEPESCRAWLKDNLFFLLQKTNELAEAKNFKMTNKFVVDVDQKMLDSLTSDVVALGCAPDYSAYSGEIKILQLDASTHLKRYAGGHIHLGVSNNVSSQSINTRVIQSLHSQANDIIRLMDYILGNIMVLVDTNKDNAERRKIYGEAGSYRLQPHGLEYRTLSNFWLSHPSLVTLATGLARFCVYETYPYYSSTSEDLLYHLDNEFDDMVEIRTAINDNIGELAIENLKRVFNVLKKIGKIYNFDNIFSIKNINKLIAINQRKIENPFTDTIQNNWKLNTPHSMYKTHDGTLPDFSSFMTKITTPVEEIIKL